MPSLKQLNLKHTIAIRCSRKSPKSKKEKLFLDLASLEGTQYELPIIMNSIWRDVEKIRDSKYISQVEQEIGVVFPHLFIETVMRYNGGTPSNNVFDTEKTNKRAFSSLLNFNSEDENFITNVFKDTTERLPKGVVPFATDPGRNYICFDYRKSSNLEIVFGITKKTLLYRTTQWSIPR